MKKFKVYTLSLLSLLGLSVSVASVVSAVGASKKNENVLAYEGTDLPGNYYDTLDTSKNGTDFLTELQTLNSTKRLKTVGYNNMPEKYKLTDGDGTNVYPFYRGPSQKCAYDGNMNREHVWPNSRGGGADNKGNVTTVDQDIHMTRPTLTSDNSNRGNSAFVEGMNHSANGWDPATAFSSDPNAEKFRGSCARIIFYCMIADPGLKLLDEAAPNATNRTMGKLSDLLKWNINYPVYGSNSVDAVTCEVQRNREAQKLQNNRNPFIDHPEYACKIWGDTNSTTQSICANATYPTPEGGTTTGGGTQLEPPTSISLPTTLEVHQGETKKLTVTPVPADADPAVTWSSSNDGIASVDNNGNVTGVAQGGPVTITATSTKATGVTATCQVTVSEALPYTTGQYNFAFTNIGDTGWTNGYNEPHTVEFDEVTVTFGAHSKQATNITDYPVSKAGNVTFAPKDGRKIEEISLVFQQWTTKTQKVKCDPYLAETDVTFGADHPIVINTSSCTAGDSITVSTITADNQVGWVSADIKFTGSSGSTPVNPPDPGTGGDEPGGGTTPVNPGENLTVSLVPGDKCVDDDNGVVKSQFVIDQVTFTALGTGNNGKYYKSDKSWRFYKSGDGGVQITLSEGYELVSATFTFTVQSSGAIAYGGTNLTSGTAVNLSGSEATFNMTAGTLKITKIEVTYKSTSSGGTTPPASPTLTSISISGDMSNKSYTVGDSWNPVGLVVTATMSDNTTQDVTSDVTWSYDPTSPAVGTTSVTVTASYQGKTANITVSNITVTDSSTVTPTITGVTITGDSNVTMTVGETKTFTATVTGTGDFNQNVTWSLEGADPVGCATLAGATVTAALAGTVTLKATAAGDATKSASVTITISAAATPTVPSNQYYKYYFYTGDDKTGVTNGTPLSNTNWSTELALANDSPLSPTVITGCTVTGSIANGKYAGLSFASGSKNGELALTTNESISKVEIIGAQYEASCKPTVNGLTGDGNLGAKQCKFADATMVTYELTTPDTSITIATGSKQRFTIYEMRLYPVASGPQVESITIMHDGVASPDSIELAKDGEYAVTASILPADLASTEVTWTSTNEDVAAYIDGTILAGDYGTATITATAGGKSDTLVINVPDTRTVTSIAISGDMTKKSYLIGDDWDPAGLVVTATMSDSSTRVVTNDAVLSYCEDKPLPGMNHVVVTATYNGLSNTLDVTGISVNAPAQESYYKYSFYNDQKFDETNGTVADLAYLQGKITNDSPLTPNVITAATITKVNYDKAGGLSFGSSSEMGVLTLTTNVAIKKVVIVGAVWDVGVTPKVNNLDCGSGEALGAKGCALADAGTVTYDLGTATTSIEIAAPGKSKKRFQIYELYLYTDGGSASTSFAQQLIDWGVDSLKTNDSTFNGNGTGQCLRLYADAKAALNALGEDAISELQNNADLRLIKARYEAWARANGDTNPYNGQAFNGSSPSALINDSNDLIPIVIGITLLTTMSLSIYLVINKKRKASIKKD